MNENKKIHGQADSAAAQAYEAPKIDEIMTPAELEREVHYAGQPSLREVP